MRKVSPGGLVIALLVALSAGCSQTDRLSATAGLSPTAGVRLHDLEAVTMDCLQYPTGQQADGSELWNADYIYLYLTSATTNELMVDSTGLPLASGLRVSQAMGFMEAHPSLEKATDWEVRLARYVQVLRGGKVIRTSGPEFVDDFDLDMLLRKHAEARRF